MKATKVEYTVKPGYVDANKANIQKVMDELKASGKEGVLYSVYLKDDGVSFVHLAMYNKEEDNIIPSLTAFKTFSARLKSEGLIGDAPHALKLEMVAKSFDL
jgi:hypothetical protein